MQFSELFSDYKGTPKVINGTKYRAKKWSVQTTSLEAFKLGKVIAPVATVMADLRLGKNAVQEELDEIYQDQYSNDMMFTQAFHQIRELLEDDHFLDLQHKLLSSLEMKDEEKDEWIVIGNDWPSHLNKEEYEADYMELLWYTAEVSLVNFIAKQGMFRSLKEMASPILQKVKQTMKDQAEKVSNEAE